MTLEEESRRVHEVAANAAQHAGREWNRVYEQTINDNGFELVPVDRETYIGADGPLWAPTPADNNSYYYRWPCVIAPKGWAT